MMKQFKHVLLCAVLAAAAPLSWAEEASTADALRAKLQSLLGEHEINSIEAGPLPGFYEATVGTEIFYISADGRYLINGDIYDTEGGLKNLTEMRLNGLRKDALAAVGEDNMVIFGPADAEDTITVFTDIDCGYCRKLHGEMDKYNAAGIRVRYLFFPRSGPNSPSFDKAVSVWCADDRQKAMTAAKKGDDVEKRECENPVMDHYMLGRDLGVTGTPALVLQNGDLVPGYIPAERLKPMLEALRKQG